MNLPCPRTVSISEFRIQFKFKLNFTWHNARHSVPQNWQIGLPRSCLCRFVNALKIVKVVKSVELTLTKN